MESVTGVPTDLLITGMGTLCACIGAAMYHEIRSLRIDATRRGNHITELKVMMKNVCERLDIPYYDGD